MAEAAHEAAAGLVPELAQELVEKIPVAGDDQLAADLAATQAWPDEAPETASSKEAAVAQPDGEQEAAVETVETPTFETEIPEDVLAFLDEPDFDAEAEAELATTTDDEQPTYEYDVNDTDDRKARIAAEKKSAWLEQRLADQNRGKWEAEAKKYFPLAETSLGSIKADSRRAFLRQARAEHEKVLPIIKPLIDQLNAASVEAKAAAVAEGREEAKSNWGTPTTGPGVVPVRSSAATTELDEARKTRNLAKIIGVLMKQGGE
jgi:hypothetical protein